MSPQARRPREVEPPISPPISAQNKPLLYSLFLLQALVALLGSLFGNGLADRLRIEPAMPYVWTLLTLVIVALVGLVMQRADEVAQSARRGSTLPQAPSGARGLLRAALTWPVSAFPIAFLLGTIVAALSVQVVPRGDAPLGLLWVYEVAAFVLALVLTFLSVAYTRDLLALSGLWLGLAFGVAHGLLMLRPGDNGPLFTTLGWIVAVFLPGLLVCALFLRTPRRTPAVPTGPQDRP